MAKLIDEVAEREGMDRSTVIRRFLSQAVRTWLIKRYLEKYQRGDLTLWQAASRCGLFLEMIQEVRKREIPVPYTLEQLIEHGFRLKEEVYLQAVGRARKIISEN